MKNLNNLEEDDEAYYFYDGNCANELLYPIDLIEMIISYSNFECFANINTYIYKHYKELNVVGCSKYKINKNDLNKAILYRKIIIEVQEVYKYSSLELQKLLMLL